MQLTSWARSLGPPGMQSLLPCHRKLPNGGHMPDVRKMVFVRAATSIKPTTAQKRCTTLMRCGDDQVIRRVVVHFLNVLPCM